MLIALFTVILTLVVLIWVDVYLLDRQGKKATKSYKVFQDQLETTRKTKRRVFDDRHHNIS